MKKAWNSPSVCFKTIWERIPKQDKISFFAGALICLACNMFVYTNTCFVHDSIMMYNVSTGIENGRLLVGPLMSITNHLQLPWVIGIISCVLMGFITAFFARIYQIKETINIVLLSGIIVTCDTIVVAHTYFSSLHLFLLSLLLAVLAVYFSDVKRYGYALSVVLMCLSMFVYQAFISVAIGLLIYKLIVYAIDGKNSIKQNIIKIIKYASSVIVSVGLYYLIWKLVLRFFGTQLPDYYAYSSIEKGLSFTSIIKNIVNAFEITILQMMGGKTEKQYILAYVITLLYLLTGAVLAIKKKKAIAHLLVFIYSIVFIVSVNTMYVLSGAVSYSLTTFSLILPIIMLLSFLESTDYSKQQSLKTCLNWAVTGIVIVTIAGQAVYANSLYLKTKVNYDNAWSYSTRLIDRLEETEGFSENTEVVIVGKKDAVTLYEQNSQIYDAVMYPNKSNPYFACTATNNGITAGNKLKWFIEQEMDMMINITLNPEELVESEEVSEMGIFPAQDSVKWIDGKLVVKISSTDVKKQ